MTKRRFAIFAGRSERAVKILSKRGNHSAEREIEVMRTVAEIIRKWVNWPNARYLPDDSLHFLFFDAGGRMVEIKPIMEINETFPKRRKALESLWDGTAYMVPFGEVIRVLAGEGELKAGIPR